ncbi:MAG: tRNA (adenosine(37)-N6)-threonylcarbamoyltransferase complex dimerization subunit type 1 TsaB [Proteobacteria bacterium]|nr:tRNA (adenosine(37)-N6)-threonylcarbamoyltransferase complex dimerization subunit type 1 TsaB [Pseudomonadota bacterium]MCL2307498.1 tRNA (adenosine(37)-N6)-threonylcarbamoyltransferase complex dimerization subunit type 1 TsaB [Pseudomonadota bacterium]
MPILALETSTNWLSVAVGDAAGWTTRDVEVGPGHSGRILPLVQETLAAAGVSLKQLDAIAFGAGPGSFTGVRIACSVAQGLALGAGVPLTPVCSLLAMAEAARVKHGMERVCTVTDARMREVYAAAWHYRTGVWHEVMAPMVARPEEVIACFFTLSPCGRGCPEEPAPETLLIGGAGEGESPPLQAGKVPSPSRGGLGWVWVSEDGVSISPSPPTPLPQGERGAKRGASSQDKTMENKASWSIVGDGLAVYPELGAALPWEIAEANMRPAAHAVGTLGLAAWARGEMVAAADAAPLYVRQRVALTSAERAAGESL